MAKKKPSSYDLPTDDKVAFGARMKHAREEANLSQEDAAARLGYTQPGKLSLMESGQRPPPLHVVIAAARLYGTTTDYLCGLAPDVDRDPAVSVQRQLTARLSADLHRLMAELSTRSVEIAREVMPHVADGSRLSAATLECHAALLRVVELNPTFATRMRGGAALLSKSEVAAETARAYAQHAERGRRVLAARSLKPDDRHAAESGAQVSMLPLFDLEPAR